MKQILLVKKKEDDFPKLWLHCGQVKEREPIGDKQTGKIELLCMPWATHMK